MPLSELTQVIGVIVCVKSNALAGASIEKGGESISQKGNASWLTLTKYSPGLMPETVVFPLPDPDSAVGKLLVLSIIT